MKTSWLSSDDEDEVTNGKDAPTITTNKKYAKKYEDQKRQLEVKELEKKKRRYKQNNVDDDSSESSSESEDEAAELLTPSVEAGIFRTLQMIKERDPAIYDKSKNWYEEDKNGSRPKKDAEKKKEKVMTYKDYMRQRIEKAAERGYASDGDDDEEDKVPETKTYNEEQEDLRQAFISQANQSGNENEDNDFLSVKKKSEEERAKEAAEMEEWKKKHQSELLPETERGALQRYYSDTKNLDENDKFLRDYILNRRWDDTSTGSAGMLFPSNQTGNTDRVNDDEDREEVEKAEEFEKAYNFRFEEAGSSEIVSYSRNVQGTMRRVDDKRKKKREERRERKRLEKEKKREELKRLKNLKQKELKRRLANIEKEVGLEGHISTKIDMSLLEEDFDPDKFDAKMKAL